MHGRDTTHHSPSCRRFLKALLLRHSPTSQSYASKIQMLLSARSGGSPRFAASAARRRFSAALALAWGCQLTAGDFTLPTHVCAWERVHANDAPRAYLGLFSLRPLVSPRLAHGLALELGLRGDHRSKQCAMVRGVGTGPW